MNPLLTFGIFIANTLALAITLSVVILALSQHPGDVAGHAVTQFLAVLAFYNLMVMLSMAAMLFDLPPSLSKFTINVNIFAFSLCVVSGFSLMVSLAGMMKQAFQVIARAGLVMIILLQWPVWTNKFFTPDNPYLLMNNYAPAGIVGVVAALAYIVMTLVIGIVYRRRIEPTITFGVMLLLLGQILALFSPIMRQIGVASLTSVAASAILGYRLARMQLFNPLLMHTAQLAALRDVSRTMIGTQDLQKVLDSIAQQARRILNTDVALILVRATDFEQQKTLVVGAQDGGTVNLVGQPLPAGDGLSGRVFVLKQSIRLQNYVTWEGHAFSNPDLPLHATMSIPLLYDDQVVGVLNVSTLKSGRQFAERDQAMLEMLAPQAAVAIVNAQLRQRVVTLQQKST